MNKSKLQTLLYGCIISFAGSLLFSCDKKGDDTIAPTIVLKGDNPYYQNYDSSYVEPGYIASDNIDGTISDKVIVSGTIDIHTEGIYYLSYSVSDKAGNTSAIQKREIRVMKF